MSGRLIALLFVISSSEDSKIFSVSKAESTDIKLLSSEESWLFAVLLIISSSSVDEASLESEHACSGGIKATSLFVRERINR